MKKKQSCKKSELRKVIIRACSSLISFFSDYSNSYVCFLYHTDIVSAISNCKNSFFKSFFNVRNNLSFLFWRRTTTNNSSNVEKLKFTCTKELFLEKVLYFFAHLILNLLSLLLSPMQKKCKFFNDCSFQS